MRFKAVLKGLGYQNDLISHIMMVPNVFHYLVMVSGHALLIRYA